MGEPYALVANIRDITRFATSRKLVSYLGLNPSVVESGLGDHGGPLHSHSRGSLCALLIQASKRLLTTVNPLQKWGRSVALRRGQNKAAVAVARKLTVAIWHVLQGHWNKTLEETTTLLTKLQKLATDLGLPTLKELGYASKAAFQDRKLEVLRTHPWDGEPQRAQRTSRLTSFLPLAGNSPTPPSRGNIGLRPISTPKEPTKNNDLLTNLLT